ncbi:CNGC5-like protein, partial [Trifolium medium]|nr:CNGC5-like protein [Trifolium medium]
LQAVPLCLNEEDNQKLIAPFRDEEFRDAAFQMHSDKAPSPDGLNPAFYKRFWSLCGNEVIYACRRWLTEGTIPTALGDTNIVLVPKCDHPNSMRDLRPISLCNVVYKILAKTLANRLQSVLDKCISVEQSGFVAGRSITDNVIIA